MPFGPVLMLFSLPNALKQSLNFPEMRYLKGMSFCLISVLFRGVRSSKMVWIEAMRLAGWFRSFGWVFGVGSPGFDRDNVVELLEIFGGHSHGI